MESFKVSCNGVLLHGMADGPEDGPLVVLLHGFPEFWYSWRRQIAELARAGFRVVAPDQRGYNLSDKPARVRDYHVDLLARDIVALIAAFSRKKAKVVGHDWGGAVTWWLAMHYAQCVERAVCLNVPHPKVMLRSLLSNRAQLKRSWYIFLFQLPWLPERYMSRNGFEKAVRALERTSLPGTFSPEELDRYREAWAQPGALKSMIHWYRAAGRFQLARGPLSASARVRIPLLLLWGCKDRFLGQELAAPSVELCDQGRLELFPDATHWLHQEKPAAVNQRLLAFLT